MKLTILHSTIGVAGAVVFGLAVSGNVAGQSAAPPAGLPPVSPAPALTPPPPTPVPAPPKIATPEVLIGAPTPIAPRPRAANPSAALPGVTTAPVPEPAIPGAGGPPVADPTDNSHGHENPPSGPATGGGAPSAFAPFKGEYITREWKVLPEFMNDGHGGSKNAQELLQQNGVTFGPGAVATYKADSASLVVRNTRDQIKLVERVLPQLPGAVVISASGVPVMGDTVSAGGPGSTPSSAGVRTATASTVRGAANYLPPPSTPPVAGMPGGRTAVNEPVAVGVLKEFPVASIDVGRANLAAELNQDPQASASRYAAIVANFDAQRQAAATAVYGLGEAYRKMGRNAEARVQYARILREFVDFPELARQSQRQLSTTSGGADLEFSGTVDGGNAETTDEERVLVRQELALLERELATTQDRIKAGLSPQSESLQLQRDILRLKQQLVRLSRGSGRATSTTPPSGGGSGNHESTPVGR
jgi:hypothetical protein